MQRNTKDTVTAHEQRVDKLAKAHRRTIEKTEKIVGIERMANKEAGN